MQYSMFFFVQTHILKSSLFYTLGFAMYSVQNITFTGSIISNIYIEMPISDFKSKRIIYPRFDKSNVIMLAIWKWQTNYANISKRDNNRLARNLSFIVIMTYIASRCPHKVVALSVAQHIRADRRHVPHFSGYLRIIFRDVVTILLL